MERPKYRAAQYETVAEREAKEKKEREEREAKERKEREEREAEERANLCKEEDHCYALFENHSTFEGTYVDLLTSSASVPEWEACSRFQNETWVRFEDGGWVEDGDTMGAIGGNCGTHTDTPVYFYAGQEPNNPENYYEQDFGSGPAIGSWFHVQEQDEGNGTWCAFINSEEVTCKAGLPLFSSQQEAGLVVHS